METVVDKNKWIEKFKQASLPVREDVNYETEEEWHNEYNKTKQAWEDKGKIIKNLIEKNSFTVCPLNDNVFDHYLTLLNKLEVNTANWLEESDNVDDDFIALSKSNVLLSKDIYMTKPYKKTWLIEFDNYIDDKHIATFFAVRFEKLNEFLFICLYSNLFKI
jgi:hypothetical protein